MDKLEACNYLIRLIRKILRSPKRTRGHRKRTNEAPVQEESGYKNVAAAKRKNMKRKGKDDSERKKRRGTRKISAKVMFVTCNSMGRTPRTCAFDAKKRGKEKEGKDHLGFYIQCMYDIYSTIVLYMHVRIINCMYYSIVYVLHSSGTLFASRHLKVLWNGGFANPPCKLICLSSFSIHMDLHSALIGSVFWPSGPPFAELYWQAHSVKAICELYWQARSTVLQGTT